MSVIGYNFKADIFCGEHVIEQMIKAGIAAPGARGMDVEDALNQISANEGIERDDEVTFDSWDFPKVVTTQHEGIHQCGQCGKYLK